ncbi:membrane dipeptidase [Thermocladium modestius]
MRLADLHEDLAYASMRADVINGNAQSSISMLRNFEHALVFAAVFPRVELRGVGKTARPALMKLLLEQVRFYLELERAGLVNIVRREGDLRPGINLLLSIEGADVLGDAGDLLLLRELGVRAIGITWNEDNRFASSCMTRKDYGLTGEGEELVRLANELGVIVDVAHASKRTVLDVASISKKPVIASHANAAALKGHKRNLDDEEIEAIVRTGGVIGVTAIRETLPSPTIQGMVDNLKYIGESFGWGHVAVGTDMLGIDETPSGFENILMISKLVEAVGHGDELWENPLRVVNETLRADRVKNT